MIPITGNTINSIDVFNGVASGFMVIASFTLSICLFILQNYEIAIVSLPLGFVSLAFYKYHKIPSKIFPGDSGALTFGAMYGVIAIIGGVEIIAAIALLPAVINSFLFLSSVKRVVEHRQIKGKPVEFTSDFKLKATNDKTAPVTLVRLILAGGPLTEKQVGFAIFKTCNIFWNLSYYYCIYDGCFSLKSGLYGFLFVNVGVNHYWWWYNGCFVRSIFNTTIW
jgi:UDP-N-acetylmuramyl pentapeptide phosphotransferase/UDP-N-acetylglucosamine-1-phosphate transferase